MRVSYDYEEMIEELKQELSDGMLSLTDTIQVLRGKAQHGYKPIIYWYYDHARMIEDLKPDFDAGEDEIEELNKLKELYLKDEPHLERLTVGEVLEEMERRNKLFVFWIEELVEDFGIGTRYKLEQLGGPAQTTTSNWVSRNTEFKTISIENLIKIANAIIAQNPKIDRETLIIGLLRDYA